jgi:hypothetical protein
MSIHPMASLTDRIQLLTERRGGPIRESTLRNWGLIPDRPRPLGYPPAPRRSDDSIKLLFPRLGADRDLSQPYPNWRRKELQALFEPTPSVQIGVLSSPGLIPLAKRYGLSLHKVSVILKRDDDFRKRIRTLEQDCYASCWRNRDGILLENDHFDRWELNTLPNIPEPCAFQPVKAKHRYLNVRLPLGVGHHQFDKALTAALATARLDHFMATPNGKAHAIAKGGDPLELMRFTAYDFGGMDRQVSVAKEIIHFRPDWDAHILVSLVEEVLFDLSGFRGLRAY